MQKAIMGLVADAFIYAGDQLVAVAKTLTDSSMSVTVSAEEIRGGKGASLIGRIFHTTGMTLTLTDPLFQIDYLAMNFGSVKTIGGDTLYEETVTCTTANALTATKTPTDWFTYGTIGWFAEVGTDNWTKCTFTNKTAVATGAVAGTKYCLKYNVVDNALAEVTVNGNIVPDEVTVVLKTDLFLAQKPDDVSTASKIGYVETVVPRFQLNGTQDLTMNMTGASQTAISGTALLTTDADASCDSVGYYAKIKEVQLNATWTDDLITMAIEGADIEVPATGSATIVTYGIFKNAKSKIIDPSLLTYTLTDGTKFQLTNNTIAKGTATAGDTDTVTVSITGGTGALAEIVAVGTVSLAS